MATIATVKELVRLCRVAKITLFIWGVHGIGKSSLVRQVSATLGIGFVDLRCAQLDAVDLRGFPDKGTDGRTHFLPPADLPAEGDGILFLDELNRAHADVLSAAFQLVLDRAVGEYRLPEGWSIVCAGNFAGDEYAVTELDPAFRDRFCHVVLSSGQPTLDEWTTWMLAEHGDAAYRVVSFCGLNLRHLEEESRDQLNFRVQPSRRSWEAVVRGLQSWEQGGYSEEARRELIAGLVGPELATSFLHFQPTLKPAEIVRLGVRRVKPRLARCDRNELASLMWGLVTLASAQVLDKVLATVLLDFAEFLTTSNPDLAVALCTAMLARDEDFRQEAGRAALLVNVDLARAAAQIQAKRGREGFLHHLQQRPLLTQQLARFCGGGGEA